MVAQAQSSNPNTHSSTWSEDDNPQWRLLCRNVQRRTSFEVPSRRMQTLIDGSPSIKRQWEPQTDWAWQRSVANRLSCFWAVLMPEILWKTWHHPKANWVSIKHRDRPRTRNYWWSMPSHQKRVSVWWVHKHSQIVSHFWKTARPPGWIPQAVCFNG